MGKHPIVTRATYVGIGANGLPTILRREVIIRFRVRWARVIGITLVSAFLAVATLVWLNDMADKAMLPAYPACITEDQEAPACFWDKNRGTGLGHSFLIHEDGTKEFID